MPELKQRLYDRAHTFARRRTRNLHQRFGTDNPVILCSHGPLQKLRCLLYTDIHASIEMHDTQRPWQLAVASGIPITFPVNLSRIRILNILHPPKRQCVVF